MKLRTGGLLVASHLLVAALAVTFWPHETPQHPAPAKADLQNTPHKEALFRVGSRTYYYQDLPEEYRRPLHEIRSFSFEQQLPIIEAAIVEAYIQQQMAELGQDRMEVQNRLMPGAEPTGAEIEAFYRENQTAAAPPLEKMREDLRTYLTAARQEKLKKTLLTQLLVEGKAQVLAEAPALE